MRAVTVLLAVIFISTAAGQSVEEEIRAEVARYVAAINGGDARAVAALYRDAPGTSSVGDGQVHHGWPGVARLLHDVYQAAGTIRMTADSIVVTTLGADAAIAVLRYQWVVGSLKDRPVNGAMTLVYARAEGGWRVVHDHTSTSQLSAVPLGALVSDSGPTSPRRQTFSCTVSRITDGDGIVCERIGRVRLIGMDTPELDQQPFGRQAAAALAAMVPVGSRVQLEPDVEARDRYGRVLAYVWVGRTMANWHMVRDGWAVLLTYPPNVQYVDDFVDAERRAREERRGLWATGGFDCTPASHRRRECE